MESIRTLWNYIINADVESVDHRDCDSSIARYTSTKKPFTNHLETEENVKFNKPWAVMEVLLSWFAVELTLTRKESFSDELRRP